MGTTKSSVADSNIAVNKLAPVRQLPGVTGVIVATMDGRTYLSDLNEASPGAAAAVSASSIGLGVRLGELTEAGTDLLELQVRSTAGYVCLYVINPQYLLGVVTTDAVNLAMLKLQVRYVLVALNELLPTEPASNHGVPGQ